MVIYIYDTNHSDIYGQLYFPQNGHPTAAHIQAGGRINMFIARYGSSEDPKNLFEINPPEFSSEPMVWGALDNNTGIMTLYLARTTGDKTYPFVDLKGFKSGIASFVKSKDTQDGACWLNRPKKVPIKCSWEIAP